MNAVRDRLRLCMISAECFPYSKVGGLSDMVGGLTRALLDKNAEVRVFSPLYRQTREFDLKPIGKLPPVRLGENNYPITIHADSREDPVVHFFIENDFLFGRDGIYVDPATGLSYSDDLERFSVFVLACLSILQKVGWSPDLIHCHDFQTALVPAHLRRTNAYPFLSQTPVLLTIHNLAYQGIYPPEDFGLTGLPEKLFYPLSPFEFFGNINLLKTGIVLADRVSTVSPTYAREILESKSGCGLDGVLKSRTDPVVGILNGIDTQVWDPRKDPFLIAPYSAEDASPKLKNKSALLKRCGLPATDFPLIGMITRLVEQKGIDLVLAAQDAITQLPCQWIIQGQGDKEYEGQLKDLASRFSDRVCVTTEFCEELAHQIEAGSDFFLMPSRFEPCGLNQMYSMRYGTIPIVTRTGGMADTVIDLDENPTEGTGFTLNRLDSDSLVETIQKALKFWTNPERKAALVQRIMSQDFSWDRSAKQYGRLYRDIIAARSAH